MEVTKDTIYVGHMSHGQRIAPNPKDAHPLKSGDWYRRYLDFQQEIDSLWLHKWRWKNAN